MKVDKVIEWRYIMSYKYAVVIVTFNRIKLLKECLKHIEKQTIPATKVIIVDNCSTDGTKEYLDEEYLSIDKFEIIHTEENKGGAGGFYIGIKEAIQFDIDWLMIIDDDAILNFDCMEKMNPEMAINKNKAYACVVETQGKIDLTHRRMLDKVVPQESYNNKEFMCKYATFCGLMVKKDLVKNIGLPEKEYFIWFDDTEYCMRINNYSDITVCTEAKLNHKTVPAPTMSGHKHASWKTYYGTRNYLHALKKHRLYGLFLRQLKRNIFRIIRLLVNSVNDKNSLNEAKLFWDAMCDGIRGNLGKNKKYLPGGKN